MKNLLNFNKYSIMKENIQHYYQPNAYSCGATCVRMINDLKKINDYTIEDLIQHFDITPEYGVPAEKMKEILNHFNYQYHDYNVDKLNDPSEFIKEHSNDYYALCLLFMESTIPHWVIIEEHNDNGFKILDPTLGIHYVNGDKLNYLLEFKNFMGYSREELEPIVGYERIFLLDKNQFN